MTSWRRKLDVQNWKDVRKEELVCSDIWAGIPLTWQNKVHAQFLTLSGPCTSRFLAEGHFPVPKRVHEGWHQESSRDFAILVTIEKAQVTLRLNT